MLEKPKYINPEMTVLDTISKYREREAIFKRLDEKAGECICCHALFDTMQDVAQKYDLDITGFLAGLGDVIDNSEDSIS
ncbi:MAG: hypothetical protein JW932_04580 [Deltaproteobacteria bacterium]|nr:hypothetical protein [Deltaproteobacteria bacterium]